MSYQLILERALACFADPSRRYEYFQLYSDDILLHGYGPIKPGLENIKQFYYAFWDVFPDARVTAQEMIEQDNILAVRHLTTGTQQKSFLGVPATGKSVALPGISVLHFRGDRCFERWTCSDSLLLLSQIGGWPTRTPAAG
jgi:predicted ester cyclase